jgi:hypothetical protein
MDIAHNGIEMNEELNDSLILVHQNMGLRQLSSLKTKQNSQTALNIFYQNIRGLSHKTDELMCVLDSCDLISHITCLSEHCLVYHTLLMIKPNTYYLVSRFSKQSYSGRAVCMCINSYLESNMIDQSQYRVEKFVEVCVAQINISNHSIILLCIYTSPSGNFGEFAVKLDLILKYLHKPKVQFVICGDFSVKFLTHSSSAQQLTLLLQSYTCFTYFNFQIGLPNFPAHLLITSL